MPPKKMETKVAALESEVAQLKAAFQAMQLKADENQEKLVALLTQKFDGENSSTTKTKTPKSGAETKSDLSGSPKLQGDSLEEFRQSVKKVELPMFDGEDPTGWITRAEVYFQVQETSPEVRINLAQLCMEGPTLHFFKSLLDDDEELTWEKFKIELVERYGGIGEGDVFEQLASLQQSGSVDEYIQEFERLTSQVKRLPDEQYFGYFVHGLKEGIRGRVRSMRALGPLSRSRLMNLARAVEFELQEKRTSNTSRFGGGRSVFCSNFQNRGNQQSAHSGKNSNADWVMVNNSKFGGEARGGDRKKEGYRDRGIRHLPYQELLERKRRNLCFKCGGPFHSRHQCPDKQLRIMVIDEEDESEGEAHVMDLGGKDEGDIEGECSVMSLASLQAEKHWQPRTMKLRGLVKGVPILILIDSGATHNFISRKLVQAMEWPVEETAPMKVKLGDGYKVTSQGKCTDLSISIGTITITMDASLFDLEGIDVVLGISWLSSVGGMWVDWKAQVILCKVNNEWVQFRGDACCHQGQEALQSFITKPLQWVEGVLFSGEVKGGKREQKITVVEGVEGEQKKELEAVLVKYEKVFQEPKGLPPSRGREHGIVLLEGQGPVNVRPYRYPHHHKNEIEKQVKEMLDSGVIRHSQSAFSSPVILVKKKDNSWRMCVDYRALNKVTVSDKFPIPIIDELLDELHGAYYFSKLDLKSGYHQVRVKAEDIHKTAFRTHEGHYEYLVMPFGLMNAPSTFQSLMNEVFRDKLRKFVLVFFDDILVYSPDWTSHLRHLAAVLEVLQENILVANKKKCFFGQMSVEYLGHIISKEGVAMDPSKVRSVLEWPIPKSVKGVRGFLGLTGYYRKFIKDYGKVARPLTELTKKDNFRWGTNAQAAFETLKQKITTAPVLSLPDFHKEFVIESDASGQGLGAILIQEGKPIAYFSKALSERNLAKSAYEKELMAVALAIQHWRPYLIGRKFTVCSDQKSLKQLLEQRITTMDQQNWAAKLLGYRFDIIYKPGLENKGADALSRMHENNEFSGMIFTPNWVEGQRVIDEVHKDEKLTGIIADLQQGKESKRGFTYKDGVLMYDGRLVISANSPCIPLLLKEFHATPQGGHSGFYRTYRRIAANLFWFGMKKTIQQFVMACDICQRQKYLAAAPGGLLQPLNIPNQIWEEVSMDFITGLPKSKGFDAVLVVVDRLSKYSHFIPLRHPYTARSVAEVFVKEVVRLHGVPASILSDRDPIFVSNFWKELFQMQGTQLKMSTAYHPQTDGQTEVVNRCLETFLRCFIAEQPKSWSQWVPWAEFWYNTNYHASTGSTPFELVYGRAPPALTRFLPGEIRVEAVRRELMDRDEILRQLKYHLQRAQGRMKVQADAKRVERQFEEGDWVFLKLRPHGQHTMGSRVCPKLSPRYFGPFQVVKRIGEVAYKLQLPESSRIHPVFHVSLLKKAIGHHQAEEQLPTGMEGDSVSAQVPIAVLAARTVMQQGEQVNQFLVQWKDKAIEEATWEEEFSFRSQFPSFKLEDKFDFQQGGNDRICDMGVGWSDKRERPKIWRVYTRRGKRNNENAEVAQSSGNVP